MPDHNRARRLVKQIICGMPIRHKKVLFLQFYRDLEPDETAEILSLDEQDVLRLEREVSEQVHRVIDPVIARLDTHLQRIRASIGDLDRGLDDALEKRDFSRVRNLNRARVTLERRHRNLQDYLEGLG